MGKKLSGMRRPLKIWWTDLGATSTEIVDADDCRVAVVQISRQHWRSDAALLRLHALVDAYNNDTTEEK